MNLVIDQAKLLKLLAAAPTCNPVQAAGLDGNVSAHLIEHVLQPMQEGRFPTIGELDFSAFDEAELDAFGGYLRSGTRMSGQIASWCKTFHSVEPIAQKQRAFC